jgi:hypothetical protein
MDIGTGRLVCDEPPAAAGPFPGLVAGAIGPEPHPNFIEVFCEAAVGDPYREVAGAGEDASAPTGTPPVMAEMGFPA